MDSAGSNEQRHGSIRVSRWVLLARFVHTEMCVNIMATGNTAMRTFVDRCSNGVREWPVDLLLAVTCDDPERTFNGFIEALSVNSSLKYSVNAMVTFQCPTNMTLRGSRISKCQQNGTWSPKIPQCEGERVA